MRISDPRVPEPCMLVLLFGRAMSNTNSEVSGRSVPHALTPTRKDTKNRATIGRRCGHNFRLLFGKSSRANQPPQTTANPAQRALEQKGPSTATEYFWTDSVRHLTPSSEASPNVACGQRLGCLQFCVVRSVFREAHDTT